MEGSRRSVEVEAESRTGKRRGAEMKSQRRSLHVTGLPLSGIPDRLGPRALIASFSLADLLACVDMTFEQKIPPIADRKQHSEINEETLNIMFYYCHRPSKNKDNELQGIGSS